MTDNNDPNQRRNGPVLPDSYFQRPSPARMWNYLQGGNDNYPLDRTAGDAMAKAFPDIYRLAKHTRQFLARAVRYVATDGDIRQFIDIGCGLPAPGELRDTHDVAQEIHPESRVLYVDNDKVVLAHARALLSSATPEGVCAYLDSDVRDTELILRTAAETLDLSRPTSVSLLGVLGHVSDFAEARSIVDQLLGALPSGSYLILADGFDDRGPLLEGVTDRNDTGIDPYHLRTMEQFEQYFDGLDIVDPGIGSVTLWRPMLAKAEDRRPVLQYGGVARKP